MIEFTIPGTAPSTPNLREHWATKAKRVKAQRAAVARNMPKWTEGPLITVRLTRVGPRSLDTDNLAAALKGHRDAVAARLRVDDASPLVAWEYHQAKGDPAVVVQAWSAGQPTPLTVGDMVPILNMHPRRQPRNQSWEMVHVASGYAPSRAAPACTCGYIVGHLKTNGGHKATCAINGYTPPRTAPMDAAKEAEAFAPPDGEYVTSGGT